jgi:hypothetical protein
LAQRRLTIAGFPNDLQVILVGQDIAQALPEEGMVVNYQYFDLAHRVHISAKRIRARWI